MRALGMDPSLRNWGLAAGEVLGDHSIIKVRLGLVQPVLSKSKQVRQNSLDMASAEQLFQAALAHAKHADVVFVEVPVGSQNARAMCGYGVCVGVLGALRASGIPLIELTPLEVKLGTVGKKTATKAEMIQWARTYAPGANWPTYKEKGQELVSEAQAEHMADALATIYAGVRSDQFRRLLALHRAVI